MDLDEIQQIFFQECEEALLAIEASYALCQNGEHDGETINTIFRGVHSIKGGAGAFGHEALQGFTHQYETLLDKLRTGEVKFTPVLLSTLLAAFDTLSDHIAAARGDAPTPSDAGILERLHAAAGSAPSDACLNEPDVSKPEPAAAAGDKMTFMDDDAFDIDFEVDEEPSTPSAAGWRVRYVPGGNAFDHGSEPLLLMRELQRMGGVATCIDPDVVPMLDALDAERAILGWAILLPAELGEDEIRGVFDFIDETCSVEIVRANASEQSMAEVEDLSFDFDTSAGDESSPSHPEPIALAEPVKAAPIPAAVETERQAKVPSSPAAVAPAEPAPDAADTATARSGTGTAPAASQTIRVDLDKLDRLVNLVGELVITQAMLAQRLSSRGLANVTELTDLDHLTRELQDSAMSIRAQPVKTVFSRVPRIIRELEGQTGKRVRLEMEGEMTEIDKTVVERIGEPMTHLIRNAVDHGLETPAERVAAGKSAEGVVRLSAEHRSGRIVISITDDGRGINRDRVRSKAIERGIIAADASLTNEEIDNLIFAPGFSTAEQVSNISGRGVGMDVVRKNVQALGGRIGILSTPGEGSVFSLSLPLTLAILDGMIVRVGEETFVIPLGHIVESMRPAEADIRHLGASTLLNVRGDYLPIQNVGKQLGIAGGIQDPDRAVLIVVESDAGQGILMVDSIQDQRQVVVKSLEANYRAVSCLAGATVLGDGRVALILDVDTLVMQRRHEVCRGGQPSELAA